MKVFTWFLVFGIFAQANPQEIDQRRLNLRADASRLSIEEYSDETKKPDNANVFKSIDTTTTATRVETLTDFIQEAVNILNTYEDTAFEDFFHILDSAIRKYHYGNCKFSEITQNYDTRKLLATALKNIREKPTSITKANINKVVDKMKYETYSNDLKELLDYINLLYRDTEPKFLGVLKELEQYRDTKSVKTHNDLARIIRHAVRKLLFDHYTELDINIRNELKEKIETFWKRFKNNPASVTTNSQDINTASASIETVKVSANVMNEVKDPINPKNNLKNVLRNKRHRSVSTETYEQQSEDEDGIEDENSNESDEQNTNLTRKEVSSGQSLDSSSNSIKQSQERHVDYNTARYVTLYTEDFSYKAKITDKTDIKPVSSNEVTKRFTVLSTSAPKYSSEDESNSNVVEFLRTNKDLNNTKHEIPVKLKVKPRTGEDDNKEQKHFKSDESKSKSKHTNTHIIGQYNAVIDVQLANTELLNGLGIFKPVTDKNSRYDSTTSQRSVKQTNKVHTKHRSMRALEKTRKYSKNSKPKTMQKTARTKPSLRHSKSLYLKPLNKVSTKTFRLSPEDINFIRHTIEDERHKQHLTRRNAYESVVNNNLNPHIIKRIDTLEKDLKDFRRKLLDENSEKVKSNNVTDKVKGNDFVAKLMDKYQNLYKKDVNNTESASNDTTYTGPNAIKEDAVNTTLINYKRIFQVINNTLNNAKEFKKDINVNSETTVTVSSVIVTDTTTLKFSVTPGKYIADINYLLDHVNDGLDLNM